MEFWGIEVKPGEIVKCEPGDDQYLHLSQASLGEVKKDKGNESIVLNVKFNDQKLVIGTLSADKCPQITYDLVFERKFELSHNWKNGSVFFVGYKAFAGDEGPADLTDSSEFEDEDTPVKEVEGKGKAKSELSKPNVGAQKMQSVAAKPNVKSEEPKKAHGGDDDDDSDDNENDSEEDESDDEDMLEGEDDSDDEDGSSEEENEQTPKKADARKRPPGSASKTPVPEKKAKLVTPPGQKTGGGADGKRGGHAATPHPAKHAGKTPATNDKSKQQTPKSAGSVSCKSCSRTFKDENALQAHSKAKHAAK